MPSPVSFKGMPARRYWEMEDASIDIGAIDAGPTDLARLMLREFALIYGNDWFVVPVPVTVGSVARITGARRHGHFRGHTADPALLGNQRRRPLADVRHQRRCA